MAGIITRLQHRENGYTQRPQSTRSSHSLPRKLTRKRRAEAARLATPGWNYADVLPAIANRPPIENIAAVKMLIIFDAAFQGRVAGAVWIVDSAENRQWFNEQCDLDAGSAVFTPEGGELGRDAILRSIWNAQEHYPQWSQIIITGVPTSIALSDALGDEGDVVVTEQGFALARV